MRKIIFTLVIIHFSLIIAGAQIIHSSKIDSILNLVSIQSISRMDKELSGDTIVTIGGIPQILYSRYYLSPGNVLAAQYIYDKFQGFGLIPKYMINDSLSVNVYAVKTGSKNPNKIFIVGAHYDDILTPTFPGIYDTIHGADDDASGVCGVLEAARLLANMNLDFTVVFVAFDNEEPPPCLLGSRAFADSCYSRGDTIIGMLNLDMIGWDGNNDNRFAVLTDTNSYIMHRILNNCLQSYQIDLHFFEIYTEYWDQGPFWDKGYKAIAMAEEARYLFNPYYHTINETFDKFNVPYFHKMVKAAIATLMTYAMNLHIDVLHKPLVSTSDTSGRNTMIYIYLPANVASGSNAPRLYYKVNNSPYNFINAYNINENNYYFRIPGYPAGTKISYYFAAQDSAGNIIITLPTGGSGINPPGTNPPPAPYVYYILSALSQCSQSSPKPINDLQITIDTIHISQPGNIKEVKVILNINHSNDGDIFVKLYSPMGSAILTQYNGVNGQNYTNTIFDDTAYMSITQGNPPFTGRYRPQSPLSAFNNTQSEGNWLLSIYDKNSGNQGTLLNWCLQIVYENTVGIKEISNEVPDRFVLYQNYPNPFNPLTKIKFEIPLDVKRKTLDVKLLIYDILGKEITTLVNEQLFPGTYEVLFDGSNSASGIYFYRLNAGDFSQTKKLILLK